MGLAERGGLGDDRAGLGEDEGDAVQHVGAVDTGLDAVLEGHEIARASADVDVFEDKSLGLAGGEGAGLEHEALEEVVGDALALDRGRGEGGVDREPFVAELLAGRSEGG